jgi:hypothetical protein
MLKIIFLVASINAQGQSVTAQVPDKARFADQAQCDTFGEHMNTRMAWVRGRLNADWEHPVHVYWRCEAAGDPA